MIFGLGDIIGPVQATSAFFCVTSQSIRPSSLITANESRCVFVAIVAEICVLLVTYGQSLVDLGVDFLVYVRYSEGNSHGGGKRILNKERER